MTHFEVNFKYALEGFRNSAGICANTGNMLGAVAAFSAFVLPTYSKTVVKSGWTFCTASPARLSVARGGAAGGEGREGKKNLLMAWAPFLFFFLGELS